MAKIAMLLPNLEIMEAVSYAANLYHLTVCSVAIVNRSNIQHCVSQALADGADIIIARGSHAEIIRSLTHIPVVEIRITSLEIGNMLKTARNMTGMDCPSIALTGPKNMFFYIDTDSFNHLFGVRLRVYLFQQVEEMTATAKKAVEDGADLVIGGSVVCEYCRSVSVPYLKTVSGRESALEACRLASQLSEALDIEKQNAASLKMLLDYTYSGIIHIDKYGRILQVNRFVETLLMMESSAMIQMPVWRIIPGITKKMLDYVLQKQKKLHSAAILINQSEFLISLSPILVDGNTAGAIISFYEGRPVAMGNEEMKKELIRQGHVAKMKFDSLISRNPAMQNTVRQARHFASFQFPILIVGESGTEKQPLAECIHNESAFHDTPFIRLNCSCCSDEEFEKMLFGKPGETESPGLVYRGPCTLYLSRIERLSLHMQYQILNLLQGAPYPSGFLSGQATPNRIRVIASSRQNLLSLAEKGVFLRDLYYNLSAMTLSVPPLRERPEDIAAWTDVYMREFQEAYGRYIKLTKDALKVLQSYSWPGNIIELRMVCSRILINASHYYIDASEAESYLDRPAGQTAEDFLPSAASGARKSGRPHLEDQVCGPAAEIIAALRRCGGSREQTARELNISTSTLWRKMKKYRIDKNEGKGKFSS